MIILLTRCYMKKVFRKGPGVIDARMFELHCDQATENVSRLLRKFIVSTEEPLFWFFLLSCQARSVYKFFRNRYRNSSP